MNALAADIQLSIQKTEYSRVHEVDFDHLVFGRKFGDHMFQMMYDDGAWQTPEIVPFGPIPVTPAMNALHYGQSIFEGMKAFYVNENTIHIFRPEAHHERFNNTARRMCIPEHDYDVFITALEELIRLDHAWVPKKPGTALYLRPFIFAAEEYLAARISDVYRFHIITSPVGQYYKEGFNPVKLATPNGYVRAVDGGTGEAKTSGNYAASFLPAREAQANGYTQVLWLDAKEHRYIEEVGTMNIHFVINGTLITPELTGSILPGVTRRSVVSLAEAWGMPVEERRISIEEVFEASASGTLEEVFGSGTAAVISPVGTIAHKGEEISIGNGTIGPLAKRMYDEITGLQYGTVEDTHGWIHPVYL
ncbi:MAG: branched-chain amino acid aminotransferase [Bacteroidota bacterium]